MKDKWFCKPWKRLSRDSILSLLWLLALLAGGVSQASGGAPDWLRVAAQQSLPSYPDDTMAVVLLDEQVTTVKDSGEIKTTYRRAYKILRPEGRKLGTVGVHFDNETRLTYLKAWSIPARGKEYEVKEKDAVETSGFGVALYEDKRFKLLTIPAAEPGNVVGYEYEQKRRPFILQDKWWFQEDIPVRRSRFVLELPSGWEFETFWGNYSAQEPQVRGNSSWMWEVKDVPAVEEEPSMPPWRAVAGWMGVTYQPRSRGLEEKSHASWRDVGLWYYRLSAGQRRATPAIREKVEELAAAAASTLAKIEALASFSQREVRYVAIEIGIGGYQPHAAPEIFSNRYGDCKDKATLLSTMLSEVGIRSHYVLIHASRGVVAPGFPSALSFNHAILAIELPDEIPTEKLYSLREHERWGPLLFFDPTDPHTPLGYLPPALQASYGLLVTEEGGELLKLPLLPPATNRLLRVGKLTLSSMGTLRGEVQEIRWGAPAAAQRARLLDVPVAERTKALESYLGEFLVTGHALHNVDLGNLEEFGETLIQSYRFSAPNYAKSVGDLLLVRPRVLGQKGSDILERTEEGQDRKYPVEFSSASLSSDIFEISLPAGFVVDELPVPVEADYEFGSYRSQVNVEGGLLRYQRVYSLKEVHVPTERLPDLKQFFRRIATDERSSAVLKRVGP